MGLFDDCLDTHTHIHTHTHTTHTHTHTHTHTLHCTASLRTRHTHTHYILAVLFPSLTLRRNIRIRYLCPCDVHRVNVADGVEEVMRLINDDHVALERNAHSFSSGSMQ